MAQIDNHIAAFQKADEFIPVFIRTVLKTGIFNCIVFDEVNFNRELFAICSQRFGICVLYTSDAADELTDV